MHNEAEASHLITGENMMMYHKQVLWAELVSMSTSTIHQY